MEEEFVPSASLDSHTMPMDVKVPLLDPSINPENSTSVDTVQSAVIRNVQPNISSTVAQVPNKSNQNPHPSKEARLNKTSKPLVLVSQIKSFEFYQALLSEFLGTLLLTLIVTSTGLPIASTYVPGLHGALVSGFTIATIIVVFGHTSGAHVNPAVTVSFLVVREIDLIRAAGYIIAQILGALTGSALLWFLSPPQTRGNLSVTTITYGVSLSQAVVVEIIITFILCFTVHAICDKKRDDIGGSKALAVGLAIIVGCLFGGPYTGGSMNPARSFAPAIIMNSWQHHWVYWLGPMLGSVLAAVTYTYVYKNWTDGCRTW